MGGPWRPHSAQKLFLQNAQIVDVANGTLITDVAVGIQETGHIKLIKVDAIASEEWSSAKVVDLKGQYLCPGLIDCHVHLTATDAGQSSMGSLFSTHPSTVAYRAAWTAKQMLLRGFTTVRDTGGADFALKGAIEEGTVTGPRLFIAGKALSQTGGHADLRAPHQGEEFKCCGGHEPGFGRICDGVPAVLEAARDEFRKGADFIKIMVGGGVSSPTDPLDMLQFTSEEIRAITTTAKSIGSYVTAHAYSNEAIRHAVDNGVLGIEHANFIDEATAKLCAEKGVIITPTLATYKAFSEPPFNKFLPPSGMEKLEKVLASGADSLSILKEAGVIMAFGTDLLAAMHTQQNNEFTLRKQAPGITDLDILQAATLNAAKLLRREKLLGQIADDFFADLLILTKNPLEDVTILSHISKCCIGIIKQGRVVLSKVEKLAVDPLYDRLDFAPEQP